MAETRLPRSSFVEDAPECFIEDGLTFNDTLAGFEPIPKIVTTNCISPIVKCRDSGFFDVATEANQSKNLLKPENQGLNRTLTEANSNLLDPESSEGIEVMVDHKELKEREEIVDQLQKKLSFLRAGGALCTTQLSDEVAAKQKVFEHLSRQLHEKRSAEKVNINSLYRFRKERIDEIGSLIEQYTVEKQNFNDEITSIDRKTQTVKKHLDSISAASTDVVEKYEELKMELMNDKVELDRLKAENSTRREAVSKTNITVRKNKLSTMERLADIADEIEKRNALITRLKENINQPNNHATSGHELNQ